MVLDIRKSLSYAFLSGLAVALAGCATVPKPVALPVEPPAQASRQPEVPQGINHKVHKGETLWRIAMTYNVPIDAIIRKNAIPDAASIEEGQLVFIPGARALKDVASTSSSEKAEDYAWPVKGKVVAYFGERRHGVVNAGIDIRAVEAELVRAARQGRVVLADRLPGQGFTVILDHGDGFFTVYAHNERLMVNLGDYVFKGDKLAQVAREGSLAYLHFEVRNGKAATNPLYYLP